MNDFEWVNINEVELWDENPRANDGTPVTKVAQSIKRFGFVAPIVIWGSQRQMVAGHTRLKAMMSLLEDDPEFVPVGAPTVGVVPVRYHEFGSDHEAAAYAIADNRLNMESEWDYELLVKHLSALDDDLKIVTGFDDGEMEALLRSTYSPDYVSTDPRGSFVNPMEGAIVVDLHFTSDQWARLLAALEFEEEPDDHQVVVDVMFARLGA